jgi:RTX calcium-binding nonapeptide repeat (4 copies)
LFPPLRYAPRGGRLFMRLRALLIVATMLLGVVVLSGVALAKNITGTNGPDRLIGTPSKDQIYGLGGPDYLSGKPSADALYGGRDNDQVRAGNGRDHVFGGQGSDELYGGGGNDVMSAADGYKDNVNCGRGTDNAYVDKRDRVNRDCENVFVAGQPKPEPIPDGEKVSGSGVLGGDIGNPRLRVNAKSTGTNPDDAKGQFSIRYPDASKNNLKDNTEVAGSIVCLTVTGNEARLVGQIDSASGPKAENGTFEKDEYVWMGVVDNGNTDKANFSAGEQTFTSCNGENPTLDVEVGKGFVVKDVK